MERLILKNDRLPWPVAWHDHFGRAAPLLLEIGFGGGDFLIDLARRRPEANVIGLEISWPSLRKTREKARRLGLANVQLIAGDAFRFLWTTCLPETVAEAYVNFPDPWPKASHHNRRLIKDRFLHLLATRMPAGGRLDVATDHAGYAAWIDQHLRRTLYFDSRLGAPFTHEDPGRFQTKYELKGLAEGRPATYFKYVRNETAAENLFPIPQEYAMPHIVMNLPLPLTAVRDSFQEHHCTVDEINVRLIRLFQDVDDDALLIETHVVEPEMVQRVGISLRRRRGGDVICHLHEFGFPRPTRGMHEALGCVGRWLLGLTPEAEVLSTNLAVELGE